MTHWFCGNGKFPDFRLKVQTLSSSASSQTLLTFDDGKNDDGKGQSIFTTMKLKNFLVTDFCGG
ncbi:MAG: hypothetical protein HC920_07135 [Oscillatoriales cyanobacterium SM2_3_0]|nr:hypothetical protein [Oscillatoriales cyanobacterium SM2_3_0]